MGGVGARFRDIRSGYLIALVVFVLGLAGHQFGAALTAPATRPYVTVAPGSVGRFCFSDAFEDATCQGQPDNPSFSYAAPMVWFRFDAPIKANAILDLSFWRIEGDQEQLASDMPYGDMGDEGQVGFGPGSMTPSEMVSKPGTYDARATADGVLIAQGLFTLVSP